MKTIAAILIAVAAPLCHAQPFIEVGIGASVGGCIYRAGHTTLEPISATEYWVHPGCSRSPLGLFAIGYQFTPELRIQLDHWSSIPDTRDRGMEILSIRYRYTFK